MESGSLRVVLATTAAHPETVVFLCRNLNVGLVLIDTGLPRPAQGPGWRHLFGWRNPARDVHRAERRFQEFAAQRLKYSLGDADRILTARFPEWNYVAKCVGVPIVHVSDVNGEIANRLMRDLAPDLGLIFGGRILKPDTLAIPRLGFLNKHSAILPRNRGVMAEFWCLYKEEIDALGVTIHFARSRLDGGEILVQRTMPFFVGDTAEILRRRSHIYGREAMVEAVRLIQWCGTSGKTQDESEASRNGYPSKQQIQELAARLPAIWQRYGRSLNMHSD